MKIIFLPSIEDLLPYIRTLYHFRLILQDEVNTKSQLAMSSHSSSLCVSGDICVYEKVGA